MISVPCIDCKRPLRSRKLESLRDNVLAHMRRVHGRLSVREQSLHADRTLAHAPEEAK